MKEKFVSSTCYNLYFAVILFACYTLPKINSAKGLDFGFKECFHTPGLFAREGLAFLRGFLFELPIAILRWTANTGMLPVILLLVLLTVIGYMKGKDSRNAEAC